MELSKLTIIALILTMRTCRGEIVVASSSVDKSISRLADDLVNIVTSCYKGQKSGVGLAGHLPTTLIRTLSTQHSMPVALIDNIRKFGEKVRPVDLQFRQKLNVFIIEASTFRKLDSLIRKNIQYSIWWNHRASFFILDLSPRCANAADYLFLAWQENILNAKVMCRNPEKGTLIYNYNPFTSQAPVSWRRARVFDRGIEHPFTLLIREYRENETICEDLDFEKTANLGGFPIRLQVLTEHNSLTPGNIRQRGRHAFHTTHDRILETICRALNATPRLYKYNAKVTLDIGKTPRWLQYSWTVGQYMMTYPHKQIEMSIVTQFRGHKSQLNKIVSIIDVDSRYGMAVVYLITLIFFKFCVQQAFVPALLNLIRMTCNTGFTSLANDTASRIYLATLLFFVVTMQGIFQGDLASLLTKQIPLRNVDTIQHLEDLSYKEICAGPYYKSIFEGSELKKMFVEDWDPINCLEHVTNDKLTAYIGHTESDVIDLMKEFNLHISRKPVEIVYLAFSIRWEWPLEQKVNAIVARMVEASVLETWEMKCDPIKLSDFYVDKAVKNNVDFKNIELHEVLFIFVILGIGLTCATIVFIIELASKCKKRFDRIIDANAYFGKTITTKHLMKNVNNDLVMYGKR